MEIQYIKKWYHSLFSEDECYKSNCTCLEQRSKIMMKMVGGTVGWTRQRKVQAQSLHNNVHGNWKSFFFI